MKVITSSRAASIKDFTASMFVFKLLIRNVEIRGDSESHNIKFASDTPVSCEIKRLVI
jgi:hypothetical protein